MPANNFNNIVIMGDSLSDRGTMATKRKFVAKLAGVESSPMGRFTDAEVWGDLFAQEMVKKAIQEDIEVTKKFLIAVAKSHIDLEQERKRIDATMPRQTTEELRNLAEKRREIQQRLKDSAKQTKLLIKKIDNLNKEITDISHHRKIRYLGQRVLRSYAEGGLVASNNHPKANKIALKVVAKLKDKAKSLFKDDKKYNIGPLEKASTLVIEWSGANDIATVHDKLSIEVAEEAVKARIENAIKLISEGYKNIVLFNLPNLKNTPRYQNAPKNKEQDMAEQVTRYFNIRLAEEVEILRQNGANIEVFDAFSLAEVEINKAILEHGKENVFKLPKKSTGKKPGWRAEEGQFFDDDVHPTRLLHQKLADKLVEKYSDQINLRIKELSSRKLCDVFFQGFQDYYNHLVRKAEADNNKNSVNKICRKIAKDKEFIEGIAIKWSKIENDEKSGKIQPEEASRQYSSVLSYLFLYSIDFPKSVIAETLKRLEFDKSKNHGALYEARSNALKLKQKVDADRRRGKKRSFV